MSGPMSVYVCSQECLKSLNHASQGNVQTHECVCVYPGLYKISEPWLLFWMLDPWVITCFLNSVWNLWTMSLKVMSRLTDSWVCMCVPWTVRNLWAMTLSLMSIVWRCSLDCLKSLSYDTQCTKTLISVMTWESVSVSTGLLKSLIQDSYFLNVGPMSDYVFPQVCLKALNYDSQLNIRAQKCASPDLFKICEPWLSA